MDKQPENKPTMYEDFKNARDHKPSVKNKKLLDKIGDYDDGPCPLSTDGFCNIAKEQGRKFYCGSTWWNSCTVYLKNREIKN